MKAPLSLVDHERLHGVEMIKLPPHSVECEQSVLGGLLLDNAAWDRVADILAEADFYRADHRLIWRHMSRLIESGKPADVITVHELAEQFQEAESIGGLAYLASLAQNTPTSANIRHYAEIVRDKAILRRLQAVCTDILDQTYNEKGRAAQQLLDAAETRILAVGEEGARASVGFVPAAQILPVVVEQIDARYHRDDPDDILGVPTGLRNLDQQLSGLQPGDLIVIGARPSMGKTAFAMTIAANVGIKEGQPVGIFSMEMPKEQIVLRLVCVNSGLHFHKVRKGLMADDDWKRLCSAIPSINDSAIEVDETAAISPAELRTRARRLHRQYGRLGLIVVDYLQLMSTGARTDNRVGELSEISRSLKQLAKELNVPVVALSQLSRNVETRTNKRPVMSDLRESGAIEQDADVILFLYRDEVYNNDSPDKGVAEIIIAKQRNGPIGTVRATWQGEPMRFVNYAPQGAY